MWILWVWRLARDLLWDGCVGLAVLSGLWCGIDSFGWVVYGFGVVGLWVGWFSGFGFCVFCVVEFELIGLLLWVVVSRCVVWCGFDGFCWFVFYGTNLLVGFDL